MKTLIVFDLKDTLVASDLTQKMNPQEIKILATKADLLLYSIAEIWTYSVLAKYPNMFADFMGIILVRQKRLKDLQAYKLLYTNIIVVGDDAATEIAFATELGYETILVNPVTNLDTELAAKLQGSMP